MHELPSGWVAADLGTLIQRIEAGLNVKCEERPPRGGERGLVKISAVTWGRFDELQSKTLLPDAVVDERNRIRTGDLLISRANTIELVGAAVIVGSIERALYLSDKVLRLVVEDRSKRWINYALKTPMMRKAIEDVSSGNQLSMRNLSQDKLRALLIPLAPLAEQQRIADKLDTVLARVDACRDRLARVAPLLKRFRQSVLRAAVSGALTTDFGGDTWLTVRLKEVTSIASGVGFPPALQGRDHGDFPFAKVSDISRAVLEHAGKIDSASNWIAAEDVHGLRTRPVPRGSTIFAKIGEGLKLNRRALTHVEMLIDNNCMAVSPDLASLTSGYLYLYLQTVDLGPLSIATAVPSVRRGDIADLEFELPSLREQTEIVRRVETLFAFADRLEARLAQAQTAVDRLTPSLLAKAFRGELVPQDPNDEPAIELLRRIKTKAEVAASRRRAPKGNQ